MADDKEIKIECLSEFPNYGKVAFLIRIIDGVAVTKYSDHRLAREVWRLEHCKGHMNISYQERLSCTVEKYPGMTKEQIAKVLVKFFEGHNTTFKK